ncbi:MAG: FAD-dependent oxidoreductase, partial [Pseudomonadota bacterium]
MNETQFDAVIIGGGVVGCALAFSLLRADAKVALIEKDEIGSGISANNFSWANATAKPQDKDYFD